MKLFIYCRGTDDEVDRQELSTRGFAKKTNLIVPRTFRDGPVDPGTFHWRCPKLNAVLSFASGHNRAAEGVLVETIYSLGSDRLAITLFLLAAELAGVSVYSVATGLTPVKVEDDPSRAILVKAIECGVAWDRYLKAQHLATARKCARRKVDFNSDDLTEDLGYARRGNLEQRQFERAVVGWIFFQRFERKLPFRIIVEHLAENRIPIPNPNFSASRPWQPYRGPYAWSVDTVRNVLSHWKARTDLLREHYKEKLPTI